jgi:hypothetical protein
LADAQHHITLNKCYDLKKERQRSFFLAKIPVGQTIHS